MLNGNRFLTVSALACTALLVLAMGSTALADDNVLLNPGFEEFEDWGDGPKPVAWGNWGLTWSVDSSDPDATLPPLSGNRAEKTMGPYWCEWCNSGLTQDVAVVAGQEMQLSAYSYVPSVIPLLQNFMVMKVEYWDHWNPHPEWGEQPLAQPEIIIGNAGTPTDVWQLNELVSTAPAGTVMARVAFVLLQPNWQPGFVFVDDVSFFPSSKLVPTVSEWGLTILVLVLAAGMAVAFGRRRVARQVA